jgi:N-acetylmuramoyl-L-alanine amidase
VALRRIHVLVDFQDAGILYGCVNDTANPAVADAYTGAWQQDSLALWKRIPWEAASAAVGAFVLRYPPSPGTMGHIAICDGKGGTVGAKGTAFGVVKDTVNGRRWDTGVLIPGVYCDSPSPFKPTTPKIVYHEGATGLDPAITKDIQIALRKLNFDPGPVDGIYGAKTTAAVVAFQNTKGLVADGEVGPQTAAALKVKIS